MEVNKYLEEFNLTKKETESYLACLKLGATTVSAISNETGIKRTTLYDILRNLQSRKLISQTIKGKKHLFYPEDPENLEILLQEQQQKLNEFLPVLKGMYNQAGSRAKFRYYEGVEGLKDVYRDTLKTKENISAFVTENIFDLLGQKFADEYLVQRRKRNIFVRAIGQDTAEIRKYKRRDQVDLRKTVLVPSKEFPFSIEMNIYGNKVAFMSFREEIGVIIESREISRNMKLLFELAWRGAKIK